MWLGMNCNGAELNCSFVMILLSFALDFILLAYEYYLNFLPMYQSQTDSTASFYLTGHERVLHLSWRLNFSCSLLVFAKVTTFITSSNLIFKGIFSKLVYVENR